jgi:cytidylate kinase
VATGKSTIAKKLAASIGYIYYDTGAMYRAITYGIIKNKINMDDPVQLKNYLDSFSMDIKVMHGDRRYYLDREDITLKIRADDVTSLVSKVSAIGAVREKLVAFQRELALGVNAVFEGRDMGTVVFPDASLKIFLIASPEVRAQRRFDEMKTKFPEETKDLTLDKVLKEITDRDEYDSTRALSPLKKADDAFVVDTSNLSLDDIVYKILECRDAKKKK